MTAGVRVVDPRAAAVDARECARIRSAVEEQLPLLGRFEVVRRSPAGLVQVVTLKDWANAMFVVAVVSDGSLLVRSARTYWSLRLASQAHDGAVALHGSMPARVPAGVAS